MLASIMICGRSLSNKSPYVKMDQNNILSEVFFEILINFGVVIKKLKKILTYA